MLIYEKDNKLNINFENKIEEPDFSIYKDEEDKVVISANGETSEAGSSGGSFIIHVTHDDDNVEYVSDKTFEEIKNAIKNNILPVVFFYDGVCYNYDEYYDDEYVKFTHNYISDDSNIGTNWIYIYNDSTVEIENYEYPIPPYKETVTFKVRTNWDGQKWNPTATCNINFNAIKNYIENGNYPEFVALIDNDRLVSLTWQVRYNENLLSSILLEYFEVSDPDVGISEGGTYLRIELYSDRINAVFEEM